MPNINEISQQQPLLFHSKFKNQKAARSGLINAFNKHRIHYLRSLKFYIPNMELPKTYNPLITEDKWYQHWLQKGYFRSVPDEREPYTIVIPPPNVTGVLQLNLLATDFYHDKAYPSFLYYNPYATAKTVVMKMTGNKKNDLCSNN